MFSHEPKDSGDENISGFGTRLAQTTSSGVLGSLNVSVRGPKHLPCLGKSQTERAAYYWSAYQNLGVAYPKWMFCVCALIELMPGNKDFLPYMGAPWESSLNDNVGFSKTGWEGEGEEV